MVCSSVNGLSDTSSYVVLGGKVLGGLSRVPVCVYVVGAQYMLPNMSSASAAVTVSVDIIFPFVLLVPRMKF